MKISLLGTGNAAQVPVYNCYCAACERARSESRYRRRACSALLECAGERWLVDAGLTDLGERFPPGELTGIFQTHYHADHAQGLLHLRWGRNLRIPVLGPDDPDGFADLYKHPGILDFSRKLSAFQSLPFNGFSLTPVPLNHSKPTFGYVFTDEISCAAYLTDTVGLPPETAAYLKEKALDLLIMDCSYPPLPQVPRNHNDLTRALEVVDFLAVKKTVLTHIGHDFDTWLIEHHDQLPNNVVTGLDGDVFNTALLSV